MTTTTTRAPVPARVEPAGTGLPSEQVHAWLEQVQDDLRLVRARLEYLRTEQSRLESQQHLLAELLAATSAV
jgi:hypothetical protein